MNIQKWIQKTAEKLSFCDNPKYEAEILLTYVSQYTRSHLLTSDYITVSKIQFQYLQDLVYRRSLGEPVAYLKGEKEFWSLSLSVSYDTLIPRPDTEILVEQVLLKASNKCSSILDLGTGCGNIALALASTCKNFKIMGVDNSKEALKIAQLNAKKLKFSNISFFYSNWFSHVRKKFNIIVSNPPYIGIDEISFLKKDIFFEPFNALFSHNNGLADIEYIIKNSFHYLFYEGWLLIEHGWQQKLKIQYFFKQYNFHNITSYKDYGGRDRVTIGQKIK